MILDTLAALALFLATLPAYLLLRNLPQFQRAPSAGVPGSSPQPWSVLIPARNEAASIAAAVRSVLANRDVQLEVVVLDDDSTDETAAIVRDIASDDPRVRLQHGAPLPPEWCGKQHACFQLASLARYDRLLLLDADVLLAPDALRRIELLLEQRPVDLLSGFPRQRTVTFLEQLLIPLIHFILLGFLSLRRMRASPQPAYAAGCGQLFVTRRAAYEASGGHAAIRRSLHDGLQLPRLYRQQGRTTDVFDATDLATCRMYRSASEVWRGLSKNATEGVATPTLLPAVTMLLGWGHVAPGPLLLVAAFERNAVAALLSTLALAVSYLPRVIAAVRFGQPLAGVLLHPVGILLFLAIQWSALVRSWRKRPVSWKGRELDAVTGTIGRSA